MSLIIEIKLEKKIKQNFKRYTEKHFQRQKRNSKALFISAARVTASLVPCIIKKTTTGQFAL